VTGSAAVVGPRSDDRPPLTGPPDEGPVRSAYVADAHADDARVAEGQVAEGQVAEGPSAERIDEILELLAAPPPGGARRAAPEPDGLMPSSALREALSRHERTGAQRVGGALGAAARDSPESLLSLMLLRDLAATSAREGLRLLVPPARGILCGAVHEIAVGYARHDPVSIRLALFAAVDLFAQGTLGQASSALLLAYRFSLENDLRGCRPSYARSAQAIAELQRIEDAIMAGDGDAAAAAVLALFAHLFPDRGA